MKTTNKSKATTPADFNSIVLKLASPDRIKEWSFGEVTKPETINYRTQRSERNGLFDEKIFGPDKDYECYCGKYRGIRYKGIVCEKCGVEITRSIVRRERMGHIELATPVSHIWFLRGLPSRIGLIMGIPTIEIEKVIYFAGYIVTSVNEEAKTKMLKELEGEYKVKVKQATDDKTKEAIKDLFSNTKKDLDGLTEGQVLDEIEYHNFSVKYGGIFEAGIGAEAIYNLFKKLDLKKLEKTLEGIVETAPGVELDKIQKRLSLVRNLIKNNIRPEWMFLTRIPVIPPALRPMVPLDGGRYATSDVNDLYRRVINRNNRLKKLKEINAPEVILRNEKRILQEAVDALIDNTIRHGSSSAGALNQSQRRPLKSLSDNLKGKRGLFRQNLLGKRVDYSGRSVIVIGPDLKLHQCGLPKHMALELFKPFVISGLLKKELAYNIRGASRLIEDGIPEVWAILEEVIKDRYVLLNRAPTLHRLGIQAFKPILIEGNAIQVHPLVCTAFNADFDGDQMAVHVPLSDEAQAEAKHIMASDKNILKPGSGDPVISNKMLDIILGCFWMTKVVPGEKGEGMVFESPDVAKIAYLFGNVNYRAQVKVLAPTDDQKYAEFAGQIFETTIGRILFNAILPVDYPFLNTEINKSKMVGIVDDMITRYGIEAIPAIMDKIKAFGFHYTTRSGTTWGIDEVVIPKEKPEVISRAKGRVEEVVSQYNEGLISEEERFRKSIEIWHAAKNEIEKYIPETLDKNGSLYDMVKSGARGSISQITQMGGMKGLIQNTAGETNEFPILSSAKEGLTPIEYFITTHGSRKGLTDTALNTAKAGYLTRRLFDVAQDVIITEDDCGTKEGIKIYKEGASGIEIPLSKNIKGRYVVDDVKANGKIIVEKGEYVTKELALEVDKSGLTEVLVRTPLACKSTQGICVKCYGADLGTGRPIALGEAVGTVAAQAIGEPGTQLTMRTFHAGGTASVGGDITQGLPRVEEVFEKRKPKNPAVVSTVDGMVSDVKNTPNEKMITIMPEISDKKGTKAPIEFPVSHSRMILVKVGDQVKEGDILTDGSADLDEMFVHAGKEKTEQYIIKEISKLYELQGENVARKHIEVMVRQMFNRRKVKDQGDTQFSVGDTVELTDLLEANKKARSKDGKEAKAEPLIMGITEVSLSRRSFLSSASFQHTTRVLINGALKAHEDHLIGLKENVIIGNLI
ncbi:MAG TPA: DNA-directed RNA polymerase subunit beta', partial [Candidatus Nanoarchaeia archaeon]|nr:DNA-directed RNA polymerase subunit beta' [Candidatus Nanoarchaeia archaeon]